MYIDCLWVSGSFKGHGYSTDLLTACIDDSKEKGTKGLCILAAAKKKPFLADHRFLKYKGFSVCDEADNKNVSFGFQMTYSGSASGISGKIPSRTFKTNALKAIIALW